MKIRLLVGVVAAIAAISSCTTQTATNSAGEQHKATIRRIHAELTKGNVAIMDEVLAPGYVRHCQAMPPELQELTDIEVFKEFLTEFVNAAPGYTDTVSQMVAEGNMVAYVSTMTGVQTGEMGGLPASGKEFTVVNIIIHRFENGKIAESWVSWDNVAMLSQLGYFPPPAPDQP
jgi:steroid delta-isomerase-like uncharacterized protein